MFSMKPGCRLRKLSLFGLFFLLMVACEVTIRQETPQHIISTLSSSPTLALTPSPELLSPSPSPTRSPSPLPPTPTDTTQPMASPGLPNPSGYEWRPVVDGLERPVGIANAGDGSSRLFILEQPGVIRIFQDGRLIPDPFLDIRDQVGCCGERGLPGLAFHPDYVNNGFFYINYIDLNGNTIIARFQVSEGPNRADHGSETRVLGVEQPFPNHNGGAVVFGPDGYLYLGLGDGGSAGDPLGNAQNTNVLLGKILRVDVNASIRGEGGSPYTIPVDNPFIQGGGAPEVWAYGLRNPWRFSFDRLTGDLYIGDVGQGSWEEIDYLPAPLGGGVNFGWNYREGAHPYSGLEVPPGLELIEPVAEYDHSFGISVTGGYVYRGERLPEWSGIYLYGDYGSGLIWGLFRDQSGNWQNNLLFQTGTTITSFGEDEAGELYFVSYDGVLYRLERK